MKVNSRTPIFFEGILYHPVKGVVEVPDKYMDEVERAVEEGEYTAKDKIHTEPDAQFPVLAVPAPGRDITKAGTEGTIAGLKDQIAEMQRQMAEMTELHAKNPMNRPEKGKGEAAEVEDDLLGTSKPKGK